jgi:hypothetical protein
MKVARVSRLVRLPHLLIFLGIAVLFPTPYAACQSVAHRQPVILYSTLPVHYLADSANNFKTADNAPLPLIGARNEIVSFQVVLKDLLQKSNTVLFQTSDLTGQGSHTLTAEHLRLFSLDYCQNGLVPDCLIPIEDKTLTVNIQDRITSDIILWIDIIIPPNQPQGTYKGKIALYLDNVWFSDLSLNLQVFPFALPQVPSIKVDLNNYGVKFLKNLAIETGTEEGYRLEHAFYSMAREHKMIFNPLPYKSQRGNPHPTMAPELAGEGVNIYVKNWSAYDRRYAPLFDGSAFKNGLPIEHQYLPFNPEWPSNFAYYFSDRQRYETEWQKIATEFANHFQEKKWSQTEFQIFMNQKPANNNTIPWNLDEPKGMDDYHALLYYALLTHNVFANRPAYKFRVDISHFFCDKHKGNPFKDFRVNKGFTILEPVDIWVISKHSLDDRTAQQKISELQKKGKTVYEYYAGPRMPLITDPLLEAVQYSWTAWQNGVDGILFWNTVKKNFFVTDGRDFLIYPGKGKKIKEPLASIRLKAIRRGIQDYEYFRLASRSTDITPLVNKHKTDDPRDQRKLIKILADLIVANQLQDITPNTK